MLPEKPCYLFQSNITVDQYVDLEQAGIFCGKIPLASDWLIRVDGRDISKIPPPIRDLLIFEFPVIGH